jgi:hypothetical protein
LIRVTRTGELGTTLDVISNRRALLIFLASILNQSLYSNEAVQVTLRFWMTNGENATAKNTEYISSYLSWSSC